MIPTIQPNDIAVFIPYFGKVPHAGDIVLIEHGDKLLIKRVIATEGESVQISPDGTVTINGLIQNDPFSAPRIIDDNWTATESWAGGYSGAPTTVPDGCVFAMGDNRGHSLDSRDSTLGMVSYSEIKGRLLWIF